MITGIQNFISQRAGLMQENILSSLTENQKRIAAVVAIIFTAIGLFISRSLAIEENQMFKPSK